MNSDAIVMTMFKQEVALIRRLPVQGGMNTQKQELLDRISGSDEKGWKITLDDRLFGKVIRHMSGWGVGGGYQNHLRNALFRPIMQFMCGRPKEAAPEDILKDIIG